MFHLIERKRNNKDRLGIDRCITSAIALAIKAYSGECSKFSSYPPIIRFSSVLAYLPIRKSTCPPIYLPDYLPTYLPISF